MKQKTKQIGINQFIPPKGSEWGECAKLNGECLGPKCKEWGAADCFWNDEGIERSLEKTTATLEKMLSTSKEELLKDEYKGGSENVF